MNQESRIKNKESQVSGVRCQVRFFFLEKSFGIKFLKPNDFSKKKNLTYNLKPSRGFTLIETLVAIAILIIAIVGPLSIASKSLSSAYYARDQVTAYYLAQEAVEYVRYLRDTNTLSASQGGVGGILWDAGLFDSTTDPSFCPKSSPCGFDPFSQVFTKCDSATVCPVFYDEGNSKLYRQSTNSGGVYTPTNFQRFIIIEKARMLDGIAPNPEEDKITVSVSWFTGNLKSPSNFKITENIMNWQQ